MVWAGTLTVTGGVFLVAGTVTLNAGSETVTGCELQPARAIRAAMIESFKNAMQSGKLSIFLSPAGTHLYQILFHLIDTGLV